VFELGVSGLKASALLRHDLEMRTTAMILLSALGKKRTLGDGE
jgi:hypothetical protein